MTSIVTIFYLDVIFVETLDNFVSEEIIVGDISRGGSLLGPLDVLVFASIVLPVVG